MRIFLTGANGYLGSLLAERLAEMPEVEAITGIGLSNPRIMMPPKTKFVQMDVRSPALSQAMAGHDVVIHTACVVLWRARMSVQERDDINLNGVRNVALAARANGVGRFIHASSMAAYDPDLARGKTDIPEDFPLGKNNSAYYYWNSKSEGERILSATLDSATLLTFLRPIYIIGPRNRKVVESYRKNAVMFRGHDPRRQFIHEEDVASAFIQAIRTEMPGAFNVVPDDFIRLSDLWQAVGSKFVPTLPVGMARFVTALRWRYFGSEVHPSWVEDMLVDFTASNAKLKAAGWTLNFNSAEALKSAL